MYEKTFNVPYYGLDPRGNVKTGLLLQFFQEAAALDATNRNIGVFNLQQQDMTWVLRRYRVRLYAHPGMEELKVRTWYEPRRNLLSVRVFELRDAADKIIGDAWSSWIVVDLVRNRPVRLDRALPPEYYESTAPTGPVIEEAIEMVGDHCDLERSFRTRWRELDMNGHTNHTVYFDWAMETMPDEIIRDYVPSELDAEYLASAQRENVITRTRKLAESPPRFAHSIKIAKTGAEVARIATTWRPA
jgi:Acyl-ACP thioesterase